MKMARSLMLGLAGSVLMAGGAMAADPMPIVVTTVPTVTVPVPGREVVIDVTAGIGFGLDFPGIGLDIGGGGLVDVRSVSGWGVRFEGYAYSVLVPGVGGYLDGAVTVYRALGDLELGVWAGAGFNFPGVMGGFGVGLSAIYEHETERLYVRSANFLQLLPSVDFDSYNVAAFELRDNITLSAYFDYYGGFAGGIGIDVDLTDRIEVWGNLYYGISGFNGIEVGTEFALNDRFSVWSVLDFDFGGFDDFEVGTTLALTDALSINTELDLDFGPLGLNYVETWAELDRPVGTGPLSLLAELGVGFDPGDGLYAWGNVGIRYQLGAPEDRENRLFGEGPI